MRNKLLIGLVIVLLIILSATAIALYTPFGQQKWQSVNRRVVSFLNQFKEKTPVPGANVNEEDAESILRNADSGSISATISGKLSPTQKVIATLPDPPVRFRVNKPFTHEYQTWNNCGPATTTMMLRQMGLTANQAEAASFMKPNPDDKNVSPDDIISYLRNQRKLNAVFKLNGDDRTLQLLISRGFPVIVEQWFEPHPDDGMGHYRLIVGYDDEKKQYTTFDSYIGPNKTFSYDEFNNNWKVFNYAYITVYEPDQEQELRQILGANWDDTDMYALVQERAINEIANNKDDAFLWFNLGGAYSKQGKHKEAVVAFDKARQIGLPWRMLWYQFEIFESYLEQGRYSDVIQLANININYTNTLEESYYYRGRAYEAQGKIEEARNDYERAVQLNKNFKPAQDKL